MLVSREKAAYGGAMNRDARELALRYYRHSDRSPAADAETLLVHPQGWVIWAPELVVLMKRVRSDRPETWEELSRCEEAPDAWYIHLLTGDIAMARRIASALPPMRYCCFRRGLRNSRPHTVSWQRMCAAPCRDDSDQD